MSSNDQLLENATTRAYAICLQKFCEQPSLNYEGLEHELRAAEFQELFGLEVVITEMTVTAHKQIVDAKKQVTMALQNLRAARKKFFSATQDALQILEKRDDMFKNVEQKLSSRDFTFLRKAKPETSTEPQPVPMSLLNPSGNRFMPSAQKSIFLSRAGNSSIPRPGVANTENTGNTIDGIRRRMAQLDLQRNVPARAPSPILRDSTNSTCHSSLPSDLANNFANIYSASHQQRQFDSNRICELQGSQNGSVIVETPQAHSSHRKRQNIPRRPIFDDVDEDEEAEQVIEPEIPQLQPAATVSDHSNRWPAPYPRHLGLSNSRTPGNARGTEEVPASVPRSGLRPFDSSLAPSPVLPQRPVLKSKFGQTLNRHN